METNSLIIKGIIPPVMIATAIIGGADYTQDLVKIAQDSSPYHLASEDITNSAIDSTQPEIDSMVDYFNWLVSDIDPVDPEIARILDEEFESLI